MIKGVVFDLDDTLYDERDYVRSGFAHVARSIGDTDIEANALESWLIDAFANGIRRDTFDRFVSTFPIVRRKADVAELVRRYRCHVPDISLETSTVDVLDALVRKGFRLGILSDGHRESQQAKITALGLERWFTTIVLTSALGPRASKPSPAGFAKIAREWSLAGASLCYVADNPAKDFTAPRELGWRSIRIRNTRQLRHRQEPATAADAPDLEIGSPHDLLGHLAS